MLANNQIDLGAPLLDSSLDSKMIIEDGKVVAEGYDPIIITPTATNGGESDSGESNNDGSSDSTFRFNGEDTNKKHEKDKNKVVVKTGTKKEFTEYRGQTNYDPFANIKIVNEE